MKRLNVRVSIEIERGESADDLWVLWQQGTAPWRRPETSMKGAKS